MSWSSGHHVMNNMYPGYSGTHGPMSASVSTHGAFFRYMSSRDMRGSGVKQEVTCLWVEPDQAWTDTLTHSNGVSLWCHFVKEIVFVY